MSLEIDKTEMQKERQMTKINKSIKHNMQEVWDKYKKYNIHVMGLSRVDPQEKGPEDILKTTRTLM